MPRLVELRAPTGVVLAWLQERPPYCDRGRYHARVDVPHFVSEHDPWPRYFFDLGHALSEVSAYVRAKGLHVAGSAWSMRGTSHEEDREQLRLVAPRLVELLDATKDAPARVVSPEERERWLYEPVARVRQLVVAASIESPPGCLSCNRDTVRTFLLYLGIDPDRFHRVSSALPRRDVLSCPGCGTSWMIELVNAAEDA